MTMTTRKRTQRTQDTSTDSVKVVEPHLVYTTENNAATS